MAIVSTSGAWNIAVLEADGIASLDAIDFTDPAIVSGSVTGSIDQALAQFDAPSNGDAYAASLTATITLDAAEDIGFYLFSAGHARLYVDGVLQGEVTVADLPGAGAGPCPANGGAVCLCQADDTLAQEKISALICEGTHEIRIEYLNLDPSESLSAEWAVGEIGRRTLDLSIPEAYVDEDPEGDGAWSDMKDMPLIAIHTAVLDDGRVLTFGGNAGGGLKYDVWDPVTDTHLTYDILTETDVFCAGMVAIPGTSKVIIAGGSHNNGTIAATEADLLNSIGTASVNIFDADTGEFYEAPGDEMLTPRWYPTTVTLDNGDIVVMGGRAGTANSWGTTPEVYTEGEGWRTLDGANDPAMNNGWYYPRAFALKGGKLIYAMTNGRVRLLDTEGDGTLTELGTLPFTITAYTPSTGIGPGKAAFMATDGGIWVMDYSGDTPVYDRVAEIPAARTDSDMTMLADGRVMINGGRAEGEWELTGTIWDPETNTVTDVAEEGTYRPYHSSSVLLRDGTLMSAGGTTGGGQYTAQFYRPDYLYDENGQPAERPQITDAPLNVNDGQTILINVGDTSDIASLTFIRQNATTHSVQMSSNFYKLDYTVVDATTIEFTIPDLDQGMDAGNWMLFAWNTAGTPSMAPILRVNPDLATDTDPDNMLLNGTFDVGGEDAVGWSQDGDAGRAAPIATEGDAALIIGAEGEAGAVSQVMQTNAGTVYKLSFDLSMIGPASEVGAIRVVLSNGETVDLSTLANVDPDGANAEHIQLTFKASGDATNLRFETVDGTPVSLAGYGIDNVTLSDNVVSNPSFEQGGLGASSVIPFWSLAGVGGRREGSASDGDGYYAMSGWTHAQTGQIAQVIPTIAGETYTISFDAKGARWFDGRNVLVEAFGDDEMLLSESFVAQKGYRYTSHTATFVATSDQTLLKFKDDTDPDEPTYWDAISLDNIAVQSATNLIDNGSFDEGGVGAGRDVPGWEIEGAGGRDADSSRATDGTGYYNIGGWSNANDGAIQQTVTTEAGKTYVLNFSAGGSYGAMEDGRKLKAEALAGTTVDGTITEDVGRDNQTYQLTFTASSDSTTIRFADATATSGWYDIDLDRIILVETPASAAGAAAPIVNGSFEDGTGWTLEGSARIADLSGSDDEYMVIRDGEGSIHQSIATRPGEVYTLTFDVDKIGFSEYDTVLQVEALNNTDADLSELVTAQDGRTVSLTFTATGLNTTIRFSDASAGGQDGRDIKIDNVSLEQGDTATGFRQGTDGNDRLSANTGTLLGGAGNDSLHLSNYGRGPEAYGGAGDDNLSGRNGFQNLYGEGGNDRLFGGNEYNTPEREILDGGDGDDLIISGNDTRIANFSGRGDLMFGGAGNDRIEGGHADDIIDGGIGNDILSGAAGTDSFIFRDSFGVDQVTGGETGPDTDTLDLSAMTTATRTDFSGTEAGTLRSGDNRIDFTEIESFALGGGNDLFLGHTTSTSLDVDGGAGNDTINGSRASDLIKGGDGDDRINGINGNDTIYGGDGDDNIYTGHYGNAEAFGEAGNDSLRGRNGSQDLFGGEGNDTLNGGDDLSTSDVDLLDGGAGDDVLVSGQFHVNTSPDWQRRGDILNGGAGDDSLKGGTANDKLDGGSGSDVAIFSGAYLDYVIAQAADGTFTLTDTRGGTGDGVDTVRNVEEFRFADAVISASNLLDWG